MCDYDPSNVVDQWFELNDQDTLAPEGIQALPAEVEDAQEEAALDALAELADEEQARERPVSFSFEDFMEDELIGHILYSRDTDLKDE